jgi:hypothetical protein
MMEGIMTDINLPKLCKQAESFDLTDNEKYLIRTCFPDQIEVCPEKELGGSLGGRRVFLVNIRSIPGVEWEPHVVKLGLLKKLYEEHDNYQNYVKNLASSLAPTLKGPPTAKGDYGAIAYAFVGRNALGKARSFTNYYLTTESIDEIKRVLEKLFTQLRQVWYRQRPGTIVPGSPFSQVYNGSAFLSDQQALTNKVSQIFANMGQVEFSSEAVSINVLPAKLNEPEMAGINGMGAAKKRPEAGLERKKGIR